ncbi:MAG: VOC family protein [Oscillospiraceae bacterium]|jgi:catechol 2,3-dioxygenase-like lactoylglutathione lyase family enzyme|nr:VOC family protein [Oscillospiraceae bacterium]
MQKPGAIKVDKIVLDCIDPAKLSDFYVKLLGWHKGYDTPDFVIIGSETGGIDIGFQKNLDYIPPVWPELEGKQQMMLHLDFYVPAGEHIEWVRYAIFSGARKADTQYSEDWTVMLDPEGHPFCLDSSG